MRKVAIHYLGRGGYYTPQTFLTEALKNGFGRISPFPLPIRSIILFAVYHPLPKIANHPVISEARIFAIGNVTGWDIMPRSPAAKEVLRKFFERLEEMGAVVEVTGGKVVKRKCGRYETSGGVVVDTKKVDPLAVLKSVIDEWNKQNQGEKVSVRDFKWVVNGRLVKWGLPHLFTIRGSLKHTRGFQYVEASGEDIAKWLAGEPYPDYLAIREVVRYKKRKLDEKKKQQETSLAARQLIRLLPANA